MSIVICYGPQGSNCYTVDNPPYLPIKAGSQNTLVIPTQPLPDVCPDPDPIANLARVTARFVARNPGVSIGHFILFKCGALVEGCDLPCFDPQNCIAGDSIGFGDVLYDSDPRWNNLLFRQTQACLQSELTITPIGGNPPPSFSCAPPCQTVATNTGLICVCDPPVPSHLPPFTRSLWPLPPPVEPNEPLVLSKGFLALNPTQYAGIPHAFRSCGCDTIADFEEEV